MGKCEVIRFAKRNLKVDNLYKMAKGYRCAKYRNIQVLLDNDKISRKLQQLVRKANGIFGFTARRLKFENKEVLIPVL